MNSSSDLISLFNDRCNYLLYSSEYDSELNTWGFFEEIFMRDASLDLPFEAQMCREYVEWREKKPYRDEQPFVYNAVAIELIKKKEGEGLKQGRRWVVFNPESIVDDPILQMQSGEFVITSPLSYVGKSRAASNARYAYALAFDLDGVGMDQLRDLLHQMRTGRIPQANFIVSSGNGVHLYYIFERPIALFKNISEVLQHLKMSLIEVIWNGFTSTEKNKQKLGIYQGFRVPGTPTKLGYDVKVRAFKNSNQGYWTVEDLNEFVWQENKLKKWQVNLADKALFRDDRLTKKQAKALYPEWYERVVVKGDRSKKTWNINQAVYKWWLRMLREKGNVQVGHRFLCLLALAMYAKKCRISYEQLEKDIYSFVHQFEELTVSDDNHFTESDAEDALKCFREDFCFVSRRHIEQITGIRIDANKRNGRQQKEHLARARILRDFDHPNNAWMNKEGRPKATAENSVHYAIVQEWKKKNINSKNKSLCARETGLDRKTVHKWWNQE